MNTVHTPAWIFEIVYLYLLPRYDEFLAMMVKLTGVRKRINPLEYVDKADIDRFRRVRLEITMECSPGNVNNLLPTQILKATYVVLLLRLIPKIMRCMSPHGNGKVHSAKVI